MTVREPASPRQGGAPAVAATAEAVEAELASILSAFAAEIDGLSGEAEMRAVQARYLGRNGRVTAAMKALGTLPAAEKPRVGQAANRCRDGIEQAIAARLERLAEVELQAELSRSVDVTLPARGRPAGALHPLTLVRREVEGIFAVLGFEVRTGPWVETEWHNFDALNTPADHPARDMQDTFFVAPAQAASETAVAAAESPRLILRSHTSPVQVRSMLAGPPPIKIIAPGNVFRRDDDATHTPMFPQVEGLCVDEQVSFADLKGVLLHFARRFFGESVAIRLRPSFFPFTEPSAEVDASCFKCGGSDPACRVCKGSGWLEIAGAGMVHPNVLRAVGYDRYDVTGYAFGMGLSRLAMLKYAVPDLRLFYDNDVRFLRQFGAAGGG